MDELIELTSKQAKNIASQKSYMLNKIFTDKNANYVKLGDVSKISTGNKDVKDADENGLYNFYIRSRNILKINSYSHEGEAILLGGDGKIEDLLHYYNGKFDYHQRVYKITSEIFSTRYLYYSLESGIGRHLMKSSAKTTVDSVRLPVLKDYDVTSKSMDEQDKIASLLSSMDELKELYSQYSHELSNAKKYNLNKIFG
ncbi:MAG: restriction endonuclease subunit S [Anaeroplasmataceae bacterium]